MADIQALIEEAKETGFSNACELKSDALEFMPEVRDMCAADRCHQYGKNWACPPACGTIEECAERASKYKRGVIVQTTGKMENEFDFEAMVEYAEKHKENFIALADKWRERFPDMLAMGAGGCDICKSCTYPDSPCRFPDKAIPSMEAFGLLVSKVCKLSDIPYYYGPLTLTYTSCYLVE